MFPSTVVHHNPYTLLERGAAMCLATAAIAHRPAHPSFGGEIVLGIYASREIFITVHGVVVDIEPLVQLLGPANVSDLAQSLVFTDPRHDTLVELAVSGPINVDHHADLRTSPNDKRRKDSN